MVIETTHKIFHLQSSEKYSKKDVQTEAIPTVWVSKKHSTMVFGKTCITNLAMEGKFIRVFFDVSKKIIAWKIKDKITLGVDDRNWRIIKAKKLGSAVVSIRPVMKQLENSLRDDSYPGLEVKKNVAPVQAGLDAGDTFYYVELKDKERDLSKAVTLIRRESTVA